MIFFQLSITQSKILKSILIFSRNNNVISVGIINKSQIVYKVVIDFSKSKNLIFSTKNSKIEKVKFFLLFKSN